MLIGYIFRDDPWPASGISGRLVLLIAGDLLMVYGDNLGVLALGVILWGLHMGFAQGVLSALIADTAPQHLRGTGFGLFNLITGLKMLAASVIAGAFWQGFGSSITFYAGTGFAALSLLGLGLLRGVKA